MKNQDKSACSKAVQFAEITKNLIRKRKYNSCKEMS